MLSIQTGPHVVAIQAWCTIIIFPTEKPASTHVHGRPSGVHECIASHKLNTLFSIMWRSGDILMTNCHSLRSLSSSVSIYILLTNSIFRSYRTIGLKSLARNCWAPVHVQLLASLFHTRSWSSTQSGNALAHSAVVFSSEAQQLLFV